jgi:flavin-dependent dehydrogenase
MVPRRVTSAADVVVVGGGPAGAAAAVSARRRGASVTLLAASATLGHRRGESLPPGGARVVADVFGTNAFCAEDHRPAYGIRSAWGSDRLDEADFALHPLGHGWHLDRGAFDRGLLDAARERGVRVVHDGRVRRATRSGNVWTLERNGAPAARGRVVVDASGRTTTVARAQGARRRRVDRLVAVVWDVASTGARDRDGTTLVEATPEGWWYTAPTPRHHRVVAFLTDADLLPPRAQRWEALAPPPHLRAALDRRRRVAPPRAMDASVAHLDRVAGPGWLATGDAVASFDPLSSQGIVTAVVLGRVAGEAATTPGQPYAYAAAVERVFAGHLADRLAYYSLEDRFPSSAFWARRRQPQPLDPSQRRREARLASRDPGLVDDW